MHRFSRPQLIIIGVTAAVVLFFGFLFLGWVPGLTVTRSPTAQPISLTMWGVDPANAYAPFFASYRAQNENVQITYRQFDERTYEQALLNALAAGSGPDIFAIHNTWVPEHYNKIAPLTETQLPYSNFQTLYPAVVQQDFSSDRVIYALPLYIDTIALLYNRDILDRNAVVAPPTTWTDVQKLVPTLVQKGSNGSVTRAAAAIGGSAQTIANAADLLSLIFFQYGISITDQGRVTFGAQGGEQALTFYTQFANPESPVYTWNDSRPSSVDSFAAGTTAMIFDYRETEKAVRAKNPFLPLMVAPVPQLLPQEPVTYARYYGLTVSNQSANPAWAWHAILSLTTLAQEARTYALTTDRLPVLRTLIGEYLSRTGFETYARQALTARSWSQPDNTQTTTILSEMIRRVIAGEQSVTDSLRQGAQRVSELAGTR